MKDRSIFILVLAIQRAYGAIPGTFFWKPRLSIDLAIPTTVPSISVALPNRDNIEEGIVVLINTYELGMTIMALAVGISSASAYPQLDPGSAYFYTTSYRWALRYFSMIPFWIGGNSVSYCDTHKVWKKRFNYMDEFVPKWMRYLFPQVSKEDWKKEEKEMKRFKKYSEHAFGKHYRYPSRVFNNFKSQETKETIERLDISSSSSESQSKYG